MLCNQEGNKLNSDSTDRLVGAKEIRAGENGVELHRIADQQDAVMDACTTTRHCTTQGIVVECCLRRESSSVRCTIEPMMIRMYIRMNSKI